MLRVLELSSRHVFPNFKCNSDSETIQWLMLKSDWKRLSPAAAVVLSGVSGVWTLKDVATIKCAWTLKKDAVGRSALKLGKVEEGKKVQAGQTRLSIHQCIKPDPTSPSC